MFFEMRDERGRFIKGHEKLGGRTRNNIADKINDIQAGLIGDYFTPEWFRECMSQMTPKDQIAVFVHLVRTFSKVESAVSFSHNFVGLKIGNQ